MEVRGVVCGAVKGEVGFEPEWIVARISSTADTLGKSQSIDIALDKDENSRFIALLQQLLGGVVDWNNQTIILRCNLLGDGLRWLVVLEL